MSTLIKFEVLENGKSYGVCMEVKDLPAFTEEEFYELYVRPAFAQVFQEAHLRNEQTNFVTP